VLTFHTHRNQARVLLQGRSRLILFLDKHLGDEREATTQQPSQVMRLEGEQEVAGSGRAKARTSCDENALDNPSS
jgi:hypothetical protein